ncbi:uncharacterized protein LOC117652468 [Thrips palmi]|uniref:Uncharacterized protein LOC117652468 n=1 Tax=Thrips palmi TaxID=161013 RepID=A0A6P9A7L7_THRPL|nr:uncharacterized protein LOC117652468 [Thrips palmi]
MDTSVTRQDRTSNMAAKILFALAAALCAFAAVSAGPARLFEDAELEQNKLDLQNLEGNKLFWINATEILEKIEESLERVQEKIELVSEEVQNAVDSIVEGIENAAASAAEQWAKDVAKWVAQANQTNTDVQACLDEQQQPLAEVQAALKADSRKCIAVRLDKLGKALDKVKAAGPAALAVLEEAKITIDQCNSLGDIVSTGFCLLGDMPAVQAKAATVVLKATASATVAAAQAAAIIPMASLCTTTATTKHAAEVSAIVDATVACIKDKIAA